MANGPWKEGRAGAISLLYVAPEPAVLAWIADHHASVGIRATVACVHDDPTLSILAARNWDLAQAGPSDVLPALTARDGRPRRGAFAPAIPAAHHADLLYLVTSDPGQMEPPPAPLPHPLPSLPAPFDEPAFRSSVEAIVADARWAILRFDAPTLAQLGQQSHRRLLQWLGDHHAHIWCAPVRDIAAFAAAVPSR